MPRVRQVGRSPNDVSMTGIIRTDPGSRGATLTATAGYQMGERLTDLSGTRSLCADRELSLVVRTKET
jgi:hypothetical protein